MCLISHEKRLSSWQRTITKQGKTAEIADFIVINKHLESVLNLELLSVSVLQHPLKEGA